MLRAKADEDNLRRRTEQDIEKRTNSVRWKNLVNRTAAGDRQPGPRAGSGWTRLTRAGADGGRIERTPEIPCWTWRVSSAWK